MVQPKNYLDFEVVKENWNKYSLRDGSKLKTRVILKSAWNTQKDGKKNYGFDVHSFTVMMCDPSLQGEKNQTKWTKEQIKQNVEIDDCRYDTIAYEANEYLLDDNTRILIHANLQKIARTKLFDRNGDRIYSVDVQASVNVTPSKQ